MSDEDIAQDLRNKVAELHVAIVAAGKAGLRVDAKVNEHGVIGSDYKWPYIVLDVYRPL